MDVAGDQQPPSLITLKELIPLKPWQTPPPPLSQIQYGKYMKVKDGARVFWAPGTVGMRELDDDTNIIAYEGFFEFIDKVVISKVRVWIDKVLGEILGLPKYDGEHSRFRREPLLL